MNKLQAARLDSNLTAKTAADWVKRNVERRFDKYLLSKMETGLCLPTVPVFNGLCDLYKLPPEDIYSAEEVDFGIKRKRGHKTVQGGEDMQTYYKLTVRLETLVATRLKAKIKERGYKDLSDWVRQCAEELLKEKTASVGAEAADCQKAEENINT